MAKKKQMKTSRVVLLVIIVIIIVVVAYQKYGGAPAVPADEGAEEAMQQTTAQESAQQAQAPAQEAKPLYPDLCYAEGGKPVAASKGCAAGEESVGDVSGFKTPYLCCVKQ
jgi:hypothetical protein